MWMDEAAITPLEAAPPTGISDVASAYIDSIITLLSANSIVRHELDWEALRLNARAQASHAVSTADTYAAVRQMIYALGVRHTFLIPAGGQDVGPLMSSPGLVRHSPADFAPRIDPGRTGYVAIPALAAEDSALQVQYATVLQSALASLAHHSPCGWIIDLRENTGGNMWPMLAGLGPLLGDGVAGKFVGEDTVTWGYWSGQAKQGKYALTTVPQPVGILPHRPVAVLVSERTASSGEAILLALRSRADARTFGSASAGLASANATYALPDGSWIAITTSLTADRLGNTYLGPVPPDVSVPSSADGSADPVVAAASEWLLSMTACKTPSPN